MIIITVTNYNKALYTPTLLDSLISQIKGANDVQVVWVDDKSTDNSLDLVKKHDISKLDNFILIEHDTNQWVSQSRNEGIKRLNENDWITFIDGDDYVKENYINVLRQYVKEGQYDVYTFDYENISEVPEVNAADIEKGENAMVWTRLYRGDFLLAHNITFQDIPYKEDGFGEDGSFNEAVINAGAKEKVNQDIIYVYRWGVAHSLSNTHKVEGSE
jgi:glycosyltransferase involved in cell wall biosynthesis